jgi:MFS family permease
VVAFFTRLRILSGIPPELRSNFVHLYFDIAWWGLYAGATAAFLSVYAVRAGATPAQIGLLAALPSAISLAISLPVGRMLRGTPAVRSTFWSALTGRMLFLTYVFIPWLPAAFQVNAILGVGILFTIPNAVIGISFSEFIMEAAPADWRGVIVSTRNAIFSIITFAVTLISGQILSHFPQPLNYQIVFFIGFVGGVMTAYHISRVRRVVEPIPASFPGIKALVGDAQYRRNWRSLLPEIDQHGRRYLSVIGLLFLFNMVNSMVAPLAPEVMVNRLHLSDSTISMGTALANMLVFVLSLFMARVTRRLGNRAATALGATLVAGHAIALGLAQTTDLYYLAALFGGMGSGVLATAQYNYHLENVPLRDRTIWLSWNLLLGNAAILIGSLGGPGIAGLAGIPVALLIFGLLRFGMGLVILKWG